MHAPGSIRRLAAMASNESAVDSDALSPPRPELDPESAEWLRTLGGTGAQREAALARLHATLLRIAFG